MGYGSKQKWQMWVDEWRLDMWSDLQGGNISSMCETPPPKPLNDIMSNEGDKELKVVTTEQRIKYIIKNT